MFEEEVIYSDDNDFPDDLDFDEKKNYLENHCTYSRSGAIPGSKTLKDNISNNNFELYEQIKENEKEEHQIVSDKYSSLSFHFNSTSKKTMEAMKNFKNFSNDKNNKKNKSENNFGLFAQTPKCTQKCENNKKIKKYLQFNKNPTSNILENKANYKNCQEFQEFQKFQEFQEFQEFPISLNNLSNHSENAICSDREINIKGNLKKNIFGFFSNHKNGETNLECSNCLNGLNLKGHSSKSFLNKKQSFKEPLPNKNNKRNYNSSQDSMTFGEDLIKSIRKNPRCPSSSSRLRKSTLLQKSINTNNSSSFSKKPIKNIDYSYSTHLKNKVGQRNYKNKVDYFKISSDKFLLKKENTNRNKNKNKNEHEIYSHSSFAQQRILKNSISKLDCLYSSIDKDIRDNNNNFKNSKNSNKKFEITINKFNNKISRKLKTKTKPPKIHLKQALFDLSNRVPSSLKSNLRNSCLNEYLSKSCKKISHETNLSRDSDKILNNYIKQFENEFSSNSLDLKFFNAKLNYREVKELFDKLHLLNPRMANEDKIQLLDIFWKMLGGENSEFINKEYIYKILNIILRFSPKINRAKNEIAKNNELAHKKINKNKIKNLDGKSINFNSLYKIVDKKIIINDLNKSLIKEHFKEFYFNLLFYLDSLKKSKSSTQINQFEISPERKSKFNSYCSHSFKSIDKKDSNIIKQFNTVTKKKSLESKQNLQLKNKLNIIDQQCDPEKKFNNYYNNYSSQRKLSELYPKTSVISNKNNINSYKIINKNNLNKCLNSHIANSTKPDLNTNACLNEGRNSFNNNTNSNSLKSVELKSDNYLRKKLNDKFCSNENSKLNKIKRETKNGFKTHNNNQKIVAATKNVLNKKPNKNNSSKYPNSKDNNILSENLTYPMLENTINNKPNLEISNQLSSKPDYATLIDELKINNEMKKLNSEQLVNDQTYCIYPKIIQNKIDREEKLGKTPILFVDIELENNVSERITVYEGDTVDDISKKISEKHNLSENKLKEIKNLLEKSIEQMIESLLKESNKTDVINEEDNSDEEDT